MGKILNKKWIPYILAVLFLLLLNFTVPNFGTFSNYQNILRQSCYIIIPAVPLTLVMVSSGIDLAIGGTMSISGVLSAMMVNAGMPIYLVLILVAIIGCAVGSGNGYLIARIGFPAFICSYTVGEILSGFALLTSGGNAVRVDDTSFLRIATSTFLGIPTIILITALLAALGTLISTKTPLGNRIYALGGNATVIRQEGINITTLHMFIYGFSGLYAAIGGFFLATRLGAGSPVQGQDYTLNCVASCILGGVSPYGGVGKVSATIAGALVIGTLRNILNMLRVNAYVQNVFLGLIMIIIVAFTVYYRKKNERALRRY